MTKAAAHALAVLSTLFILLGSAADVQARSKAKQVRDLHYGEVLFHFYQQDSFTAISRLLAAEQQERLPNHAQDAQVLLGGLYLGYGQQDAAAAIFAELLRNDTRDQVRDRAWFYLAKIAYQRGEPERAAHALEQIGEALEPDMEAERRLLGAQLLMRQGQFGGAVAALESWRAPRDWLDYARFNLGVALVRHGREQDGTRLLAQIGAGKVQPDHVGWARRIFTPWYWLFRKRRMSEDISYDEHQALTDKANLALGFAYLQNEAPAQAAEALVRIEADSPWASKALLGQGWAHAAMGDYQAALAPWESLKDGDRFDPAVQESLLAVPYALGKMRDQDAAVEGYSAAIASFNDEMQRLDALGGSLDQGQFLDEVLEQAPVDQLGWFFKLSELPDTPQSRYLYQLLADHSFQEGLKNYRDLRFLTDNLGQWQAGLSTYVDMLDTRLQRYHQRVELMRESLREDRMGELEQVASAAHRRLQEVTHDDNAAGLASEDELALMSRLKQVEQRLALIPATQLPAGAVDKARLLRGVLRWRQSEAFPARLWEQRKATRALDDALATAGLQRESLLTAREHALDGLEDFRTRIEALRPRIAQLQARIDLALNGHQRYLETLAEAQIEGRRQRLRAYLTEAQFALASVYDTGAHAGAAP